MRTVNSTEEHEALLQNVIAPIYDAMLADPSRGISSEEMDRVCRDWDREDGLVENSEPLKRSA